MSSSVTPDGKDADLDISPDIAEAGSKIGAEAVLKYYLGAEPPENLDKDEGRKEFAKTVALNIFDTFSKVRSDIKDAAKLGELLDEKIEEALDQVQGRVGNVGKPEQHAAALNAIEGVLGEGVMERRMKEVIAPYGNALENEEIGTVSQDIDFSTASGMAIFLGSRTTSRVTIDSDHVFWTKNKPANAPALAAQLDGKTLSEVGISIQNVPSEHKLNSAEVALIMNGSGWDVVDLKTKRGILNNLRGKIHWSMDLDDVLRQHVATSVGVQHFGACTYAAIVTLLQDNTYRDRLIPALRGEPNLSSAEATKITDDIFARMGKASPSPTDTLAVVSIGLESFKEEAVDRNEFLNKLQDGAQNKRGVAVAMAMIAERPNLLTSLTASKSVDEKILRKDKRELVKRKEVHETLNKFKDLNFRVEYTGFTNYADLAKEHEDLSKDFAELSRQVKAKIAKDKEKIHVDTEAAKTPPIIVPFTPWSPVLFDSKATKTITHETDMGEIDQKEVNDHKKEFKLRLDKIEKDISQYNQAVDLIQRVYDYASVAGIASKSATLTTLIKGTKVDKAQINKDLNPINLVNTIITEFGDDLEPIDKLDALISAKDKEINTPKEPELKGDALQLAIFKKYCEEKGIPNPEGVANYVVARTVLDQEVDKSINRMLDERFDEDEGHDWTVHNSFYYKVINKVAEAAGVPLKKNNSTTWVGRRITGSDKAYEPDWSSANYEQLCTSYFALRRLHDGAEGEYVNLSKSNEAKQQMKIVGRLIATKFGMDAYNRSIAGLSAEERKKLPKPTQHIVAETTRKFLDGEAPEESKGKIDKVINKTKAKIGNGDYKTLNALQWTAGNILWRDNGISARSLLYGNKYLSAKTAVTAPAEQLWQGAKFGWRHKLKIGVLGGLAVVSGGVLAPALFAAAYAAGGSDTKPHA